LPSQLFRGRAKRRGYLLSDTESEPVRAVRVTHEVWCQALRARTILASTGSAVPQVDMIISALWADKDEVQLALMQQVIAILCAELKRTAAGSRRKRHSGRSGLKEAPISGSQNPSSAQRSSAQTPTTKPMRSFESAPFVLSTIRQIAWKKGPEKFRKFTENLQLSLLYHKT
jgi:hypothetical protein